MHNSIRLNLLLWYALILAAVIGVFSATLDYMVWNSQVRETDAILKVQADRLVNLLGYIAQEGEEEDVAEYFGQFRKSVPEAIQYQTWDAKGAPAWHSSSIPVLDRPTAPGARFQGTLRELAVTGPGGTRILVERDLQPEFAKRRDLVRTMALVGAGVFIVAMLGGWFLAGRALAPVDRITRTASLISASDLSRRIDVGRTENELGRLARTLNETFDRIEEAFDRQTRFTADASHELRTPLSILMTHAELALKKERSGEEYRETLTTCVKAAQRMKAVVEGLLTLARADAHEANLQREAVDLKSVVEEAAAMLAPLAAEKKVALAVEATAAEVTGDRSRLGEVTINLVSNALRYNREGGRVDVTLRTDGADAVLTVADTGMGIPEKDQPHIFERFYRVDKARSREAGGTGLGLAIAKWVVEAHGGTLAFTSREGEGTAFTMRIPRRNT